MSEKKDLYRLEEEKSLEQIADYFEKLASDLRNGHITFDDGTSIKLPETLTLDIDVDEKHKEDIISTNAEFELKWVKEK